MSTSPLGSNDKITTRTLLHESIPLTGTIVSGTYADTNIKNYAHGMFQSVYDYPYLSSSANHIFDITLGYASQSPLSASSNAQNSKKLNIYSQMAQVLMGYDATGSILRFDADGNVADGGTKHNDVFFLNFARLLSKDEVKKGTFQLELGVGGTYAQNGTVFARRLIIEDSSGSAGFLVNSPAGEYGVLYATGSTHNGVLENASSTNKDPIGLIFYQAGVAVISGSVFMSEDDGGILNNTLQHNVSMSGPSGINERFEALLAGSQISSSCDNIRTVGLYNDANVLMAVAKLSEPLKKTPDTEFTIRVRLDY